MQFQFGRVLCQLRQITFDREPPALLAVRLESKGGLAIEQEVLLYHLLHRAIETLVEELPGCCHGGLRRFG